MEEKTNNTITREGISEATKTPRQAPRRISNTRLRAMYLMHSWQEEAETTAMIDRFNERENARMQSQLRTYGYVSAHHIGASTCM